MKRKLGVGLIGAHTWAQKAHLPGYVAHDRVDLVAVCDIERSRAETLAAKFGAKRIYTSHQEILADPDVEMIDVCTPTHTHLELSLAAITAGKHVLCEKPLATQAEPALAASRAAGARQGRPQPRFTFPFLPAPPPGAGRVAPGALGEIFHIHGFEQNSQFLDPDFPLRQVSPFAPTDKLIPSSIIGYGSHLVDLMRWLGGEFKSVASTMRNFVPVRQVRGAEGRRAIPVEDGTVAIVEFASGAHGLLQSSYIAGGNYPGVELRIYGSKGAAVARLVTEYGVAETLHFATPDAVEFRKVEPAAHYYAKDTSVHMLWAQLYYRNLVRHYVDEILEDRPQECTFH